MRKLFRIILSLLILSSLATACAEKPTEKTQPQYPDPQRFEKWIGAYLTADKNSPPEPGGIVAVGSSSMYGWHETIQQDLAPLTIIPRGFGGSNMNDLLYYSDQILINYKPRAVLIYEGDNDVAGGISAETILETFNQLQQKIHQALPETRIYLLSIKPSISRWHMWPDMEQANQLLESACAKDDRLTFIDIGSSMLNDQGTPIEEIFRKDMLHMNDQGYRLWTNDVKPILLDAELKHEESDPT
jgi:lysophospholipase L1-like esterase